MPVTIKGPDLVSLFQQANQRIEINTEDELDIVANLTQSDAIDQCPVSQDTEAHEKGDATHMRDDIKIYTAKLRRQIGTNKNYGVYVHNGTYKMPARPFLVNPFEANRQSLVQNLQNMKI